MNEVASRIKDVLDEYKHAPRAQVSTDLLKDAMKEIVRLDNKAAENKARANWKTKEDK